MAFHTLYIEPDLGRRQRFRQAASAERAIAKVGLATTLIEGLLRLDSDIECDVVYLSTRYDSSMLESFLTKARNTRQGSRAAFVAVVCGPKCELSQVTRYNLFGIDAVLLEPFSSQQLFETLEVAKHVASMRGVRREKISIELLLHGVRAGLRASVRRAARRDLTSEAIRPLRTSVESLISLPESFQAQFLDRLVANLTSEGSKYKRPVPSSNYPVRVVRY